MRSYRVRGNFVIVRVTSVGSVGRIRVSDTAEEGKVYTVAGFGPEVKDLSIGDRITLFADHSTTFFAIPGERDLIIIKDINISAVIEENTQDNA